MMITRYLSSAAAGLAVTTSLLWVMHYLIEIAEPAVSIVDEWPTLNLGYVKDDSDTESAWIHDDPPLVRPVPPDMTQFLADSDTSTPVKIPAKAAAPANPSFDSVVLGPANSTLVSIINARPEYPISLSERRIEGFVVVRFDVTEAGTVENVTVVESTHRGFNRAAMRAAQKSRYRPTYVDGVAQRSTGLQKIYRFEMEQ